MFKTENVATITLVSGAGNIDTTNVDDIVAKAIGQAPDEYKVLAYLIRRFGLPTRYIDEYKNLCRYILTTPMDGLYLSISPLGGGFGYLASKELSKKINDAIFSPGIARCQKIKSFAKEKYGVHLFTTDCFSFFSLEYITNKEEDTITFVGNDEFRTAVAEYNRWCLINDYHDLPEQEEHERFMGPFNQYKEAQIEECAKAYDKFYPEKEPDDPLIVNVKQALADAAVDLLRYTNVRDVYFNVLGYKDERTKTLLFGLFVKVPWVKWRWFPKRYRYKPNKAYERSKELFGEYDDDNQDADTMDCGYFDINPQMQVLREYKPADTKPL